MNMDSNNDNDNNNDTWYEILDLTSIEALEISDAALYPAGTSRKALPTLQERKQ